MLSATSFNARRYRNCGFSFDCINEVDAIRGISENHGVAHVLNSSLNKTEIAQVKADIDSGITKLLYVAPESLIKEEYVTFLKTQKISFVAIDEAHCISEWGHDFRPEYRNLKHIIKAIDDVPIICLTATATEKVQEDILKTLGITDANRFKASFNRPNLFYEVRPKTTEVEKDIIRFVKQRVGKSGIIYCLSRKKVEDFILASVGLFKELDEKGEDFDFNPDKLLKTIPDYEINRLLSLDESPFLERKETLRTDTRKKQFQNFNLN